MDNKMDLICESVQEVTLVAWPIIYGEDNKHDLDSRMVLSLCRGWGEEFENSWLSHSSEWRDSHDYISEVESFAEKKALEYLSYL